MIAIGYEDLPAVNASLNAASAVTVFCAWRAIKARRIVAHRRLMLAAVFLSACFLTTYLVYHLGPVPPRSFDGEGVARVAYLAMLVSHVILAAVVVPLVVVTVVRGLRDDRMKHVRLAKWTLPIWAYVSVTGVVVYLTLYGL